MKQVFSLIAVAMIAALAMAFVLRVFADFAWVLKGFTFGP